MNVYFYLGCPIYFCRNCSGICQNFIHYYNFRHDRKKVMFIIERWSYVSFVGMNSNWNIKINIPGSHKSAERRRSWLTFALNILPSMPACRRHLTIWDSSLKSQPLPRISTKIMSNALKLFIAVFGRHLEFILQVWNPCYEIYRFRLEAIQ